METGLFAEAVADVKNYIDYLSSIGCRGFDCNDECLDVIKNWGMNRDAGSKRLNSSRLVILDNQWKQCRKCHLSQGRKNIIPGRGGTSAKIMFVGDIPSAADDAKGELFTGETGVLFEKMIAAMNLSMKDVFITTAVKCRPSGENEPGKCRLTRNDYGTCMGYLTKQIEFIKPEIICTLGAISTTVLLGNNIDIAKSRGNFHPYQSIRVFPTFHPDFLIAHPEKKRDSWTDLQKLMKVLNS
jgi:DNA polymerase